MLQETAKTLDELIEMCKLTFWDRRNDGGLFYEDISHYLDGKVGSESLFVFWRLSKKIQRRNVLFMSEEDICVYLYGEYSKGLFNKVRRCFKELQDNDIVKVDTPIRLVKSSGKDNKDSVKRIIFNWMYVWKGDIRLKRRLIEREQRSWIIMNKENSPINK